MFFIQLPMGFSAQLAALTLGKALLYHQRRKLPPAVLLPLPYVSGS